MHAFGSQWELGGAELEKNSNGERMCSHTMNADLYLGEQADFPRIDGRDLRVVGVMFHLDEAVVALNGATYMYPIRVSPVKVHGGEPA